MIGRSEARRIADAAANPDDALHEKVERMAEMFAKADEANAVKVTYVPVAWWRTPITVPAWVYGLVLVGSLFDSLTDWLAA